MPQILAKKGCDASNMYDEEASTLAADSKMGGDVYFSDDEKEQAFKRAKKNKKRGNPEEGEIVERHYSKKADFKRQKFNE